MSGRIEEPGSQATPVRAPRSAVVRDPGRLSSFWRAPRSPRGTWLRRALVAATVLAVALATLLGGGFRERTDRGRELPFSEEYTNGPLQHRWQDAVARPAFDGGWEVTVRGTCTNVTDEPWQQPYGSTAIWGGGPVRATGDLVAGRLDPTLGPTWFQPGVPTPCRLTFKEAPPFQPEDHYGFQERVLTLQQADLFDQEPASWRPSPDGVVHVFFPPLVVEE